MGRSITVSTTSIEVPAEKGLKTSFNVTIDGSKTNGSFTVHPVEEDWIDVIRDGNVINLSLKRNLSLYERVCVITVEHNVIRGEEGIKEVNVVQKPMACTLNQTAATHTFALFPEEEKTYDVIVKGGNKNIRLLSVKKYYEKEINFEEITGYRKDGRTITVDAYNDLSDLDKSGYEPVIVEKSGDKKIYVPNDGCIGVNCEYIREITGYRKDGHTITVDAYNDLSDLDKSGYEPVIGVEVESGDEFKKYKITLTSLGKTYFDVEKEGTTATYQCHYLMTFAHCDDLTKTFVVDATYDKYAPKTKLTPKQPNSSVQTRFVKKKSSKFIKENETVEEIVIEPMFELDIDSDTIEFEHGVKESVAIGYKALPEGSVLHIRTTSSLITGNYDDKYVYLNVSPNAWGLEKRIGITIENINCYSDTYKLTGIIKPL